MNCHITYLYVDALSETRSPCCEYTEPLLKSVGWTLYETSFCILWIFFSCKFIPHLSISPSRLNIIDLKVEKCRKIKAYKIIRELLFVWQVGMQIYQCHIFSYVWYASLWDIMFVCIDLLKASCCIESKGNHYLQRNWECMGPHGGTLQIILKHLTQIQYQWTWKPIFTYNVSIISVVQWVVTVPEHSISSNILSPSSQENINGSHICLQCTMSELYHKVGSS